MVEAEIFEERAGRKWGTFRFLALPSSGDQIHVGSPMGIAILQVFEVEHHPVKLPISPNADPDGYIQINVTEIGHYGV